MMSDSHLSLNERYVSITYHLRSELPRDCSPP